MSGFNQYGAIFLHRVQCTEKILPLRARFQFLAAIAHIRRTIQFSALALYKIRTIFVARNDSAATAFPQTA